ncbi:MAG: bifunctional 23S rRNA (guanine(2069)-N(7))-methyltransferase RlmK/23S rRNA (guanine(2445)-N(2))-methyltransferase RlmL [Gammaproteobacteria bacterium]|nr:bifunctional 23S rRNA (guanine(2069)-N(7))-methyltransferase RlmK/23S rRNA (guanine(2445)-N(2))-methyltransferase RlmL [Gammaproteobacteria bacterium]
MTYAILVTCAKGLEYLLEEELKPLGLTQIRVSPQGVFGRATLAVIYDICLWSRIANRVLLVLCEGEAYDPQQVHQLCRQFAWDKVFQSDAHLDIHFQGISDTIRNSMFGAQIIKDGIVDYCRDHSLERPTIDRDRPDIRIRAYLHKHKLTVGLDLTGYSLHQRGYRLEAGEAPLKETVASAVLLRAKWPVLCAEGVAFYDPCCGAGTLVIEAAMLAAHIAPGLLRQDQAFSAWFGHDPQLWAQRREEAEQQQIVPSMVLHGSDQDDDAIAMAQANAIRAGVAAYTMWSVQALTPGVLPTQPPRGLLVSNPPYGERLGEIETLLPLYQILGQVLHDDFSGWEAAILTSEPDLARGMGLRSHKQYKFYNGPLACQLYCLRLDEKNRLRRDAPPKLLSEQVQMFANRLKKNHQHLRSWVQRNQIDCYRVYDADLPEYAFAIDIYKDFAVLQEYAPPASVPPEKAEQRRQEVMAAVPGILGLQPDQLILKQRARQRGVQQYEKIAERRQFLTVREGGALLRVNLQDYLDTGLFLDHRLLRLKFATLKPGTKFLNCFCYTGTASVHAATAGALTTNVDLSRTYLSWAEENFRLNAIDASKHQFVQYDCLEWLDKTRDRFDVIFLDPPSFSNSKRMNQTMDVTRDHVTLIRKCMALLTSGGVLYFSTNLRQFKLSPAIMQDYAVQDITPETIDVDFKRNAKIHQCYKLIQP